MFSNLQKFVQCKAAKGLKSSQKRLAIIEYFLKKDRHFTTEQLYYELKKINQKFSYSTVYRSLKLLADCGLASISHFEKGVTRFEPIHTHEHHDHLICVECGRIIEFTNQNIEKSQKKIAGRYNFQIRYHKLELYGLCENCLKKDKP